MGTLRVGATAQFWRLFRKLPRTLREEAVERIESFRDLGNHQSLRVHKLHGKLEGRWSFSVNYRYRIVFVWEEPNAAAILVAIGDHSLYD